MAVLSGGRVCLLSRTSFQESRSDLQEGGHCSLISINPLEKGVSDIIGAAISWQFGTLFPQKENTATLGPWPFQRIRLVLKRPAFAFVSGANHCSLLSCHGAFVATAEQSSVNHQPQIRPSSGSRGEIWRLLASDGTEATGKMKCAPTNINQASDS
jgi:hypothetical protein